MSALAKALPCEERLANLRAQYEHDQLASARLLREAEAMTSLLRAELRDARAELAELRRS